MHKPLLLITACLLLTAGCSVNLSGAGAGTPTLFVITSTLPASLPPPPSSTPLPAAATATTAPVEGLTTTQVNVRSDPSSAGSALGIIGLSAKVEISGKDSGGNWYRISYPQAPGGTGWISAKYVQVQDAQAVPVIAAPGDGPGGVITEQVNVRSGPGTTFDALATLNQNDAVSLLGKDSGGQWLQVQFKSGPGGQGWVSAGYVKAAGLDKLPIVAQSGETIGTGTPSLVPATITPTLVAAPQDGDSAQDPAVNVTFSPSGMRTFIYSGSVSTPEGDGQDWIQFIPYTGTVIASLSCAGNGALKVELSKNGAVLPDQTGLACGDQNVSIKVEPGQTYLFHVAAVSSANSLTFIQYTLTVETQS